MARARVVMNRRELAALPGKAGVLSGLVGAGESIAATAARLAPRETGEGAASIRAEVASGEDGPEVRVSWDERHFYLGFHEFGTARVAPRPFLRPAAQMFD